jgi:flagellar motor switch protein FliM
MSDAAPQLEFLSRDEIGALVDELRRARDLEHETRRLPGMGADGNRAARALRRALERFAVASSRALASRFQRRLEMRLLTVDEMRAGDFADLLLPPDRLVAFSTAHDGKGFVLIGRPLLFAWMRLSFGATADLRAEPLPERPPTPIESGFLKRVTNELLAELGKAIGTTLTQTGIEDATSLRDARAARLLVVGLELAGIDEIGRVRIALPREVLAEPGTVVRSDGDDGSVLENAVLDAEVAIAVGAGGAVLSLAHIARLEVGETIPIEAPAEGLVTVAVDGAQKFLAQRGQLGSRLAIQIVDRVAVSEE